MRCVTEDADHLELEVRVGSGAEGDARSRAMAELNLLAQGLRAKQVQDEFLLRIRDVARNAAREMVDQVEHAHHDRDLAVEVADAVLDALLDALEAPAAETAEIPRADGAQEAQPEDGPKNPVHLRVATWLTVDAVLDNAASVRVQGGNDDAEVVHAHRLRQRGWRANEQHPQRGLGEAGWPPDDELLPIELSGGDLRFLLDRLEVATMTSGHLVASAPAQSEERGQWEQELESLDRVRDEVQALEEARQAESP